MSSRVRVSHILFAVNAGLSNGAWHEFAAWLLTEYVLPRVGDVAEIAEMAALHQSAASRHERPDHEEWYQARAALWSLAEAAEGSLSDACRCAGFSASHDLGAAGCLCAVDAAITLSGRPDDWDLLLQRLRQVLLPEMFEDDPDPPWAVAADMWDERGEFQLARWCRAISR